MNISSSTNISDIIINVTTTEETGYTITQIVFIGTIAAILSMLTVVGNVMVMISFKIDKQLQTISNYFLFSLAAADFAVGLISMPLFTVSTLLGYWPLGPFICDTWLALDYLASNASVLNLLIISFDRYFSVTRPLTYRAKRTNKKAAIMIGSAWGISLLLWPPWIYSWPYIEGQRTVPDNQCYIQFIETNHYITFGTAIAAFYVPVSVMVVLYWKIWLTTLRRNEELSNLQAGTQENSKRSNSSDEATNACSTVEIEELRRKRSESSTAAAAATENDSTYNMTMMHSSNFNVGPNRRKKLRIHHKKGFLGSMHRLRAWCLDWWHSGREDSSDTEDDSPSEQGYLGGYITPISLDTPLPSSVSRCTSLNVLRDSYVGNRDNWSSPSTTGTTAQISNQMNVTPTRFTSRESRSLPPAPPPPPSLPNNNNRRSDGSTDSVYTILIRLPGGDSKDSQNEQPTIQMIPETYYPPPVNTMMNHKLNAPSAASVSSNSTTAAYSNHINRRPSAMPDVRIALNAKGIANKNVVMDAKSATSSLGNIVTKNHHHVVKKKEKKQEKKNDMKAAKTLTAILFTFIFTWLPYNVAVLLKPFAKFDMPLKLWDFFYYLCYINSTINPICYALCNASFRRTYLRILRCKWHSRNRAAVSRGFYNN